MNIISKKFRAWDHTRKCWVTANALDISEAIELVGKWDTIEITQLMPLPDADGKQLYEGDVVYAWRRQDCFDPELALRQEYQPYKEYRLVEFKINEDSATLALTKEGRYNERGNPAQWRFAGNIYENPELLKLIK